MRENAHNDRMNALLSAEDKGIQKGLQQGLQQGAQQAKAELAQKLLTQGFDIHSIADLTGLSLAELATLQTIP
jgi:predicted transposase/invertase (TIGR01784 family)